MSGNARENGDEPSKFGVTYFQTNPFDCDSADEDIVKKVEERTLHRWPPRL
jgi:hypothetical protein